MHRRSASLASSPTSAHFLPRIWTASLRRAPPTRVALSLLATAVLHRLVLDSVAAARARICHRLRRTSQPHPPILRHHRLHRTLPYSLRPAQLISPARTWAATAARRSQVCTSFAATNSSRRHSRSLHSRHRCRLRRHPPLLRLIHLHRHRVHHPRLHTTHRHLVRHRRHQIHRLRSWRMTPCRSVAVLTRGAPPPTHDDRRTRGVHLQAAGSRCQPMRGSWT